MSYIDSSRLAANNMFTVTPGRNICVDPAAPSTHIYEAEIAKLAASATADVVLKAGALLDLGEDGTFSSAVAVAPAGVLLEDVTVPKGGTANVKAQVLVAGTVDNEQLSNCTLTKAIWAALCGRGIYLTEVPA